MNPPLPIDGRLAAITAALGPGSTLLLQAEPGAGKTTRVPLALLESLGAEGRLLLLEPRRLAARNAAQRLAAGLGEPVGGRVGYSVRLESRTSSATRLEVVTAGLFLRRLQADPALDGVACVIFDEFHERQAEADLALALVRQARSLLRPELRLLVMSATLDLAPLASELDGAAVISCEGRSHPVAVTYQPPRPDERLDRQVLRALEGHWLAEPEPRGTALVFLPGLGELETARRAIEATAWGEGLELALLHGQLPLAAQGRAIAAPQGAAGKVVLATSVAESSLTIAAVTVVIDSGLSRRSRFDPATGMDGLVTQPASQASAEQRSGRAGRLGPGRCLRLWSPAEQQRRAAFDPPELLEVDPLPIALQLAEWGETEDDSLPWLTAPPRRPLAEARDLLLQLGAVDGQGRITGHGRAMARLGLHPRLAHMLLRAKERGWESLATAMAVLLSERDPLDRREAGSDLMRRLDWLRRSPGPEGSGRGAGRAPWTNLQSQLLRQLREGRKAAAPVAAPAAFASGGGSDDVRAAQLLAWAYPERLALGRGRGDGRFLMRGGRGAVLPPGDPLAAAEALAIASVDGQGQEARVRLAVALSRSGLEELVAEEIEEETEARWDGTDQRVRCERLRRSGALVLERRPWPDASGELVERALLEGLERLGLEVLPWCRTSRQLQQRLMLAHQHLGAPWPDRSPERLQQDPGAWLGPHLGGLRSLQDLQQLDLSEILWGDLDWSLRRELDRLLPLSQPVPSGRRVPLDYGSGTPVLAVKLQEMFGCLEGPTVLDGRLPVRVELLSPAGRPAAVTSDLAGFWSQGYAEVRRELRGRYPRHPWPEDPRQGVASARTKAALAREARGESR
ncbi:ATP-dependent helicase HrpB [Synechococcus sp. FACHB-909]|uniref:ATP-dependent helicase HrpB n=1 Tax=Synechococcus sp. FACHB-909 TaxID=2692863 RepID=UPI001686A5A6|nr:ATP-dependent helicase HrpB [Synechococcus sp. FACHB-909]MBD2720198.1 ATP-dependent helicase HrpB [Synechococcus sp. FACHB-909]